MPAFRFLLTEEAAAARWRRQQPCVFEEAPACMKYGVAAAAYAAAYVVAVAVAATATAVAAHAACLLPDMTCSRSRKSFCVCHIYELRFARVLQATSHAMCHLWLPLQQQLLLFNYVQLVCSLSQQMMSLQRVLTDWPHSAKVRPSHAQ